MISNDMAARVNAQVNMELYSAYFYLALSSHAESGSLKGVSDWFMAKHYEEQAHAIDVGQRWEKPFSRKHLDHGAPL